MFNFARSTLFQMTDRRDDQFTRLLFHFSPSSAGSQEWKQNCRKLEVIKLGGICKFQSVSYTHPDVGNRCISFADLAHHRGRMKDLLHSVRPLKLTAPSRHHFS